MGKANTDRYIGTRAAAPSAMAMLACACLPAFLLAGCMSSESADCHFQPYKPQLFLAVDSIYPVLEVGSWTRTSSYHAADSSFHSYTSIRLLAGADSVNVLPNIDTNGIAVQVGSNLFRSFSRARQGCDGGPDCYSCREIFEDDGIDIWITDRYDTTLSVRLLKDGAVRKSWSLSYKLDTSDLPTLRGDTVGGGVRISLDTRGRSANRNFRITGTYLSPTLVVPDVLGEVIVFSLDSSRTRSLVRTSRPDQYQATDFGFCLTNVAQILEIRLDSLLVGGDLDLCLPIPEPAASLMGRYAGSVK